MRSRIFLLATAFAVFIHFTPAAAAAAPEAEKQKIEALLAKVEGLSEAKFIRNGSDYDAKTAAKFLRGKWSRSGDEIQTAKDFIAKAGTGSSTSGKPYLIRMKDGKEVTCAEFLNQELRKLEGEKK